MQKTWICKGRENYKSEVIMYNVIKGLSISTKHKQSCNDSSNKERTSTANKRTTEGFEK